MADSGATVALASIRLCDRGVIWLPGRMGPLIVDYEAATPTGRGGEMPDDLKGMKVAILATDGVERIAKASVPG